MQPLILSQAQAEAIYSAMCALNNVGMQMHCESKTTRGTLSVSEDGEGRIVIIRSDRLGTTRRSQHADQSAFATAYNLQQG